MKSPTGIVSNTHHRLNEAMKPARASTAWSVSTSSHAPTPTRTPVAADSTRNRPPARSAVATAAGILRHWLMRLTTARQARELDRRADVSSGGFLQRRHRRRHVLAGDAHGLEEGDAVGSGGSPLEHISQGGVGLLLGDDEITGFFGGGVEVVYDDEGLPGDLARHLDHSR